MIRPLNIENLMCRVQTWLGVFMRDPNRIDELLDELPEVWMVNPDLRLGHLTVDVMRPTKPAPNVFYIEADALLTRLHTLKWGGEHRV